MYIIKEKIYPAFVSKYYSNFEKQFILLMIPNREGHKTRSEGWWHYLAIRKLSWLLKGITSKCHGDFYCLNCFHSFATKKNFNCIKEYVKTKIFLTLYCFLKTLKY